jgi:hypothetical protein
VIWPVEEIPDADQIYMRVHKMYAPTGELKPGAFRDQQGGMSADWEEYATPEDTRNRARNPADNGVIGMTVGDVRAIESLTVVHEPLPENRAHTEVFGEKDPEVRVKLRRIARWCITLRD